jgi:hypothetical protein
MLSPTHQTFMAAVHAAEAAKAAWAASPLVRQTHNGDEHAFASRVIAAAGGLPFTVPQQARALEVVQLLSLANLPQVVA